MKLWYEIRVVPLGKNLEIDKRTGTFIQHSSVKYLKSCLYGYHFSFKKWYDSMTSMLNSIDFYVGIQCTENSEVFNKHGVTFINFEKDKVPSRIRTCHRPVSRCYNLQFRLITMRHHAP